MTRTNDTETTQLHGPRRLPVVRILGRAYFVDECLGELRACDNPLVSFPIDSSDWAWGD